MSKVGSGNLALIYDDGSGAVPQSSGTWKPEEGKRVKALATIKNTGSTGPIYLDVKAGSQVIFNKQIDVGGGQTKTALSNSWMPTSSTMTYRFHGWR